MPIASPVKLALASALLAACASAAAADVSTHIAYTNLGLAHNAFLDSTRLDASGAASASVNANNIPRQAPNAPYSTYMSIAANADVNGMLSAWTILKAGGETVARTVWHDSIVNQSGAAQTYQFNYKLAGSLATGGWTAWHDSRDYRTSFSAEILVNGISVWHAERSLTEDLNGYHLAGTGADIGAGGFEQTDDFGYFDLPEVSGAVSLGQLGAGQGADVSYVLTSRAYWNDPDGCSYECGRAGAAVYDPLGVGGSRVTVSAVPEADTYAMLLGGLGLLGLVTRRRRPA